jgi:hypothetical protein
MNARRHVHLALLALALVAACSGNPVGRICDLGTMPDPGETALASPSLDCVSRTCLKVPLTNPMPPKGSVYPGGANGLCTAECQTADDCERVPESPCVSGFTCGIPEGLTVGPFCCRKFCVCKDYIVIPDTGQLPTPMACDAANAQNGCCNLPGRTGNPQYPLCKT